MIVAPPKAGKTIMMQNIAQSIVRNNPECHIIVLLIDERPEEVTEMQRTVRGEVIASTFDEPPTRHVQVAEMVIEKAKRLVEHKKDVVISSRLNNETRACLQHCCTLFRKSVDWVESMQMPWKNRSGSLVRHEILNMVSLTIVATALVETGSKMDEVIYESLRELVTLN